MKVRAILEFDLEGDDEKTIEDRRLCVRAAEATDDAIRARLIGQGFLAGDTLIGSYKLSVRVVDLTTDDVDLDDLMETNGGAWGEHPDHPVESWMYEVANGDTRAGYWRWVATRAESNAVNSKPPDHS